MQKPGGMSKSENWVWDEVKHSKLDTDLRGGEESAQGESGGEESAQGESGGEESAQGESGGEESAQGESGGVGWTQISGRTGGISWSREPWRTIYLINDKHI